MADIPKKGDRFTWGKNVTLEVLRVSKAGDWADISVTTPNGHWTKRQHLPFPDTFKLVA